MITRHDKTPVMHSVVEHEGVLYLAGQVADDSSAGMKVQTAQALASVGGLLEANGSDKSGVLSATVYVTDFALKPEMNEAWTAFFGEHLPARATIGVADLGPGILIEVVVTAAKSATGSR